MYSTGERTREFKNDEAIPYFLWDRDTTVGQLREALDNASHPQHTALLRVLLREARPDEVWAFVSPEMVAREWDTISPGLGRRRAFWDWLLAEWRRLGFLQ